MSSTVRVSSRSEKRNESYKIIYQLTNTIVGQMGDKDKWHIPDGVVHAATKSYMFDTTGSHTLTEQADNYTNRDPEAVRESSRGSQGT